MNTFSADMKQFWRIWNSDQEQFELWDDNRHVINYDGTTEKKYCLLNGFNRRIAVLPATNHE